MQFFKRKEVKIAGILIGLFSLTGVLWLVIGRNNAGSVMMALQLDSESWLESRETDEVPFLTAADIFQIGEISYVESYDYSHFTVMDSFHLQSPDDRWTFDGHPRMLGLRGTANNLLLQVDSGLITLVDGRYFTEEELNFNGNHSYAIVSTAFADTNYLEIGDTFTLYSIIRYLEEHELLSGYQIIRTDDPDFFADEFVYKRINMEFQIVGLYELNPELNESITGSLFEIFGEELLFVPNTVSTYVEIQREQARLSSLDAIPYAIPDDWLYWYERGLAHAQLGSVQLPAFFVLSDASQLENFIEAASQFLPSPYFYFTDEIVH
ncbi:MAG: hypothetical protein FWE07_04170 [Turicibacter sp.]|nr:hypothetical protein [Turicibacter sp.]